MSKKNKTEIYCGNGCFITADDMCWILQQEKEGKSKKTGQKKTVKKILGYFGTLYQALKYAQEKMLFDASGEIETMEEAVEVFRQSAEEIDREIRNRS